MLLNFSKQPAKLEGNSIGILNVRKRIKRLFDWQAHDCEVVGEAGDGMEALRLQITDYILKPVNYEEFGACIGRDAVPVPAGLPGGNHGPLNLKDIHS